MCFPPGEGFLFTGGAVRIPSIPEAPPTPAEVQKEPKPVEKPKEERMVGKITSIPLEGNHDLLVLLNNTVGEAAGSSERDHLLPRIYRKWKDILSNLEEAHLFKGLGKKKEYEEGIARAYHFTETEKDNWANLFEYKGSEENVRLKFAIDRIGAGLDDIVIIYEDAINSDAWEKFLLSLKEKVKKIPETAPIQPPLEIQQAPTPLLEKKGISWHLRYRWILVAVIMVMVGAGVLATERAYFKPLQIKRASLDSMAFPLPDKPSIAVLPLFEHEQRPSTGFLRRRLDRGDHHNAFEESLPLCDRPNFNFQI